MAVPVVEMRHVTKCFAKVIANKDVSLTVGEGGRYWRCWAKTAPEKAPL